MTRNFLENRCLKRTQEHLDRSDTQSLTKRHCYSNLGTLISSVTKPPEIGQLEKD